VAGTGRVSFKARWEEMEEIVWEDIVQGSGAVDVKES
jgi:hypothetical protein